MTNRPLIISVLGNVLLVLLLLWLVEGKRTAADHATGSVSLDASNVQPASPSPPPGATEPAGAAPTAKPFNWSELESSDYRAYIANLAAIGCPKQTIRDIIVADVDSLYAPRRQQCARQPAAESKLSALYDEEDSVLTALLGPPPASTQIVADTNTPPVRTQRRQGPAQAVSEPLVFQDVDPSTLQLTDMQKQVISRLRQQFIDQIGGTNQDPNDPAYLARWQKAQHGIDDTLRGTLGIKFYVNYRLQAANAARSQ
jgi:hypothetical protein